MTTGPIEDSWRWMTALSAADIASRTEEIFARLEHPDWRARRTAAQLIARIPALDGVIDRLVDAAVSEDLGRRNAAIEALRAMKERAAKPVLARLERTAGSDRRFLLEALMEGSIEEVARVVAPWVDDPDGNIAHAAVELLGVTPGPAARDALVVALSRPDPVLRIAAMLAFEVRVAEAPWAEVIARLSEGVCARTAVRVLAAGDDLAAARALAGALEDPRLAVRREALIRAAQRLRESPGDDFSKALLGALRGRSAAVSTALDALIGADSELEVRGARVWLAGCVGDRATVLAAWAEGAGELRAWVEAALDALAQGDDRGLLDAALAWGAGPIETVVARVRGPLSEAQRAGVVLNAWSNLQRASSWALLGRYGLPSDLDRVEANLEGLWGAEGDDARALAIGAIVERRPEALQRLSHGFELSEPGLRRAEVLSRWGAEIPYALLNSAVADPRPGLRASALRLMADDPRFEVEGVAAALRDDHSAVRIAAAGALSRRGDAGIPALRGALDHPDGAVALMALLAVGADLDDDALAALTRHGAAEVVAEALARLRERSAARARARAIELLSHGDWRVRIEAVRALAGGDDGALVALEDRQMIEDDALVHEALSAAIRTENR